MDQAIFEVIQKKIEEKHTYHMNAFSLEDITKLVYGNKIQMLESPNDTTHEYTVHGGGLTDDDQKTLTDAVTFSGLEDWNYDLVLEDLCEKGYVKPGKYFVRMSW